MWLRLGGLLIAVVYDVIETSSTMPFSTIQCCEISIFSENEFGTLHQKPLKLQELLFDYIFKLCKNYVTFY